MSIQLINIGALPGDGTGDKLRAAMSLVNENMQELEAGLGAGSIADRGLARVVHIALREDEEDGSGTATNPYNGNTAARFDALMREIADSGVATYVLLGPGTFLTRGRRHSSDGFDEAGDLGWSIGAAAIQIEGYGMGITTIQLEEVTEFDSPAIAWAVVYCHPPGSAGIVVKELTVDANYPNLTNNTADMAIVGVSCYRTGAVWYEKVEVINGYSNVDSTVEGFQLAAFNTRELHFNLSVPADESKAAVAIGCKVHSCHAPASLARKGYNVGIALFNGNAPVRIEACQVYNLSNHHSGGIQFIGNGVTILANRVMSWLPIYLDTGDAIHVTLDGNHFIRDNSAGEITGDLVGVIQLYGGQSTVCIIKTPDVAGSMDGKYFDIPIRPTGGASNYVLRAYFNQGGLGAAIPSAPAVGTRLSVTYSSGATIAELMSAMRSALDTHFGGATTSVPNPAGTGTFYVIAGTGFEYTNQMDASTVFVSHADRLQLTRGNNWSYWTWVNNTFESPHRNLDGFGSQLYFMAINPREGWLDNWVIKDNKQHVTGTDNGALVNSFSLSCLKRLRLTGNSCASNRVQVNNTTSPPDTYDAEDDVVNYGNRDPEGRVPNAYPGYFETQPAALQNLVIFSAYPHASPSALSATTHNVAQFTQERSGGDPTGAYTTTTSRFTAAESGWYHFDAAVRVNGVPAQSEISIGLLVNGIAARQLDFRFQHDPTNERAAGMSGSANLKLTAGDYVQVYIYPSAVSANTKMQTGSDINLFEGYLLALT